MPVDVRVMEGQDATDKGQTWASTPSLTGRREHVDGLSEAMGECMHNYLNAHRAGEPDLEAGIAALYAQLRRPPDPLWDPDPVMVEAVDRLVLTDPRMPGLQADIRADALALDAFHVDLDRAAALEQARDGVDGNQTRKVTVDHGGLTTHGLDEVTIHESLRDHLAQEIADVVHDLPNRDLH